MNKSEQLIACLEGEIARRDARIEDLEMEISDTEDRRANAAHNSSAFEDRMSDFQVENGKLNDLISDLRAELARVTQADAHYQAEALRLAAELAAIKAQVPVLDAPYGGILRIETGVCGKPDNWVRINPCKLYAAPVSEAKAQGVVMPEGWIPLTIEHEPGYPEDVAFGPKRMMDRLKKWLDRYFEMRLNADPVQQVSVQVHWTGCHDADIALNLLDSIYAPDDEDQISQLEQIVMRMGKQFVNSTMLIAAPATPAADAGVRQATDGGRNQSYEGLFDGETEEQRASRLAACRPPR